VFKIGRDRARKPKSTFREYAEALIIAIILALVIRQFVVQAFKIPSGSMIPTLMIGDHILVSKLSYWFTDPHEGDIVVFRFPRDKKRDFIKRIIGGPGDEIQIVNKVVIVNDIALKEPYTMHNDDSSIEGSYSARDNFGPVVVPPHHYFMMGDNRDNSMDSRYWGFLDGKMIKGKAFLIYWSWDKTKHWPRWDRIGNLVH